MSVGVCVCVCVCVQGRCVNVLGCGWLLFVCECSHACASVFVHLFLCLNASHVPACVFAYSSNNNEIICSTHQTYGLLIRIEQ